MVDKALIIFGTTGSLAKRKIFPALISLENSGKLDKSLKVIGYGRKNFDGQPIDNFTYVRGELTDLSGLVKLIKKDKIKEVFCFIALPPGLYIQTIDLMEKHFKGLRIKVALEKPFGNSLKNALELAKTIEKYGGKNFYLIDHYLAKQSIMNFSGLDRDLTNPKNIIYLEASMFETGDVSERGALYDELGAIKDTGQNHVLNMAAAFFEEKQKISFLKNLKYKRGSLLLGQYGDYGMTPGVKENSQTETYFRADFDYKGTTVTLRSGKAMNETRSFLNILYKDGRNLYIEIGPNQAITPLKISWRKEIEDAHKHVIRDFLQGNRNFSLTLPEALEAWRITDTVLADKKDGDLKIYPRGANFDDIEKL